MLYVMEHGFDFNYYSMLIKIYSLKKDIDSF